MRKIMRVLAIIYIAYLAVTVLFILPALNFLPSQYVKQAFDRQLQTEIVLFNPFTLSLEARKAQLPEHNGEPFVSLRKAAVNLSLASLWQTGWVFDAVEVDQLYLHVRQLSEERFNFSDLIPAADETPAPEDADGAMPGVTIEDFNFHSRRIVISNETREEPFSTHWDNLAIRVQGLSTVIEEGRPYRLDASGEAGGSLHWEGEVSVPAASSSGRLTLSNISLHNAWRFAKPWVNFELTEGRLHMDGHYELDWRDALNYSITQGEVALSGIAVQPLAPSQLPDTGVELTQILVAGITLDGQEQHATVESISVDGLAIAGWSEGARVSLAELFAPAAGDDADDPGADSDSADTADDEGWSADIQSFNLRDNSLRWRSEFTDPQVLEVRPIQASAQNIKWPLSGNTGLSLELAVNEQATLTIGGELALASGDGNLDYTLGELPLPWFNPNFPAALKAKLTGGLMAVEGQVALAGYTPAQVKMNGAITGLSGQLQDTETVLTSWETVRWQHLLVDLEQQNVTLEKLSIDDYSGRLHIRKDGSINAQNVFVEEFSEENGEEALAAEAAAAAEAEPAPGKPWTVSVPAIMITDSQIDFMDESLPLQFRTVIGELNGEILGLSTAPGAAAQVDIKGSVDGYAPVLLAGTAAPFGVQPALDLSLQFDGVDMALLTPYSGTYAGYAIDRGLLSLTLEYALQDARLKGNNKVVIEQMKLGEKVESDKAVNIPLELALALLTDVNGVIDLEVPVSGNVDDPKFSVGSVIFNAFVNLITKAVTAPFSLLASLVSSEEDLQRINFASGSAVLDEAGKSKLDQLHSAMLERPQLTLLISGSIRREPDRERLQKNALRAELLEQGLSLEELDSKGELWEKAIMARARKLPAEAKEGASVQQLYQQLAQGIEVTQEQLGELAQARAVSAKSYLVNEAGLDAGRAVIEEADLERQFSGVELGIDI